MKFLKYAIFGILTLILFSGCISVLDISEEGQSYTLHTGDLFTITLSSNPSTGYSWEIDPPIDETIVKFTGTTYEPGDTNLVGSPGKQRWHFKTVGKGQTTITFKYIRQWEETAVDTKTFTIIVQ